ncbi:hypothetical protein C8R31_101661 [Nitrosospira sp. Nsp2]|uniref:hypothetical protein n=1 Tax=Nitrosospira sp. Nsp2 TaxID=136548 RepID=UPI000D2FAC59|nr:hypothetical protein [Nitrosospira sp. Nsp2]PTR17497.1 hypothetical protein C8R31_101661 [Nitrosospira sp. Nsp2]
MKYKVAAPFVEFHSGVLVLSKEQVRDRIHNLKKVKNGYEVVNPVQFKCGEVIGYDGELNHYLADAFGVPWSKEKSKKAAEVQTSAQTDTPPDNPEDVAPGEEDPKDAE